jgi:SH3-like domain-containing protein
MIKKWWQEVCVSAYPFRMMENRTLTMLALVLCLFAVPAGAADEEPARLPIPRFVTLGTEEVNVRTGPGLRYPVRVVLRKEGLPVEIVKEFDAWRQIVDKDGDEGWVHKSLLSGKRAVIVSGPVQTLLRKPDEGAKPVVKLEPGVIAGLDRCDKGWCYLRVAGYKGWLKRENVWGVLPDETFTK